MRVADLAEKSVLILSLATLAVACSALVGWYWNAPMLIRVQPGIAPMQVNTALGFALASAAAFAERFGKRKWATGAGALLVLWGAIHAIERLTNVEHGLGRLLIDQLAAPEGLQADRPGLNTAIGFVLVGLALAYGGHSPRPLAQALSSWLITGVLAVAAFSLAAFALEAESSFAWPELTGMAINTAASFTFIGTAILIMQWRVQSRSTRERFSTPGSIAIAGFSLSALIWLALTAIESQTPQSDALRTVRPAAEATIGGAAADAELETALQDATLRQSNFARRTKALVVSLCIILSVIAPLFYLSARRSRAAAEENQRLALEISAREERLERAIRGSTAGVYDWDLIRDEVYWSPAFKDLLGLPASFQPSHQALLERIHPEDREQVAAAIADHLERGIPYNSEHRMLHTNGAYLWVHARGQSLRDLKRRPLRLAGSITDISERKAAELALKESESLFRSMIESLSLGVLLASEDGAIRRFNTAAAAMLGYEIGELAGLPVSRLAPGDGSDRWTLGPELSGERPVRRKDGSELPAEINVTPLRINGEKLALIVIADISERRKAKLELDTSNERFRMATEGASVGIWDWPDVSRDEEWWSPRFYRLLGYENGELPAAVSTFRSLLHPDDSERAWAKTEECLATGSAFSVDYRLRVKSGEYRWFVGTGVVNRDAAGRPQRMVGSIQDIHERRQAEEVRIQNAALLRSNRDLAEFTYVASHDLQEPLRTITNFLELLRSRYGDELNDEAREFIRFTVDGATRMRALISGLLSLSRVDSHAVPPVPVALDALLATTRDSLRQLIEERGVTIESAPLPTVPGFPILLAQLFQNLVENAIKYMPPDRAPQLRISAELDDEAVTIAFADNGIGIAEEFHEHVFGLFKRLHGRKAYEGCGIGLSLCRKIAEKHMGRIWIAASGPEGTVFKLRLPRRAPAG